MAEVPGNYSDAKKLRQELERIARETLPELRDALKAGADEQTLVDILTRRTEAALNVVPVDVPAAAFGGDGGQAPSTAQGSGSSDGVATAMNALTAQVINGNQILAQMLDVLVSIDEAVREGAG